MSDMDLLDKKLWLDEHGISYGEMGTVDGSSEDVVAGMIYDSAKEDLYAACLNG